jgi:hypothetical protein
LPIFVARVGAPGRTTERARQVLLGAGATRVLDTLTELRDTAAVVARSTADALPPKPAAA